MKFIFYVIHYSGANLAHRQSPIVPFAAGMGRAAEGLLFEADADRDTTQNVRGTARDPGTYRVDY